MTKLPLNPDDCEKRAVNLRPDTDGTLTATGTPRTLSATAGAEPYGCIDAGDGTLHLLCRDLSGSLVITDTGGHRIGCPDDITDILSAGADSFAGITAAGTVPLLYAPEQNAYRALTPAHALPAISLYSSDAGEIAATAGERTLSAGYQGAMQLLTRDADALTADITGAYDRIRTTADAAGTFVQPVLVRYRLLDSDGHDLYVSPPVLLSSGGSGVQGTEAMSVKLGSDSKGRTTVPEYTLRLRAYRVNAYIPAALAKAWEEYAHSYIIEVSPQIDTLDTSRRASYSMNPRTESQRMLSLRIPGADCAEAILTRAVPAMIDSFDRHCRILARGLLSEAAASGLALTDINFADTIAPARRYAAVKAAAATQKTTDEATAALRLPHSFMPRGSAVSGRARLWFAPEALRFAGYGIQHYGAGEPEKPASAVRMAARVEFADGGSTAVSSIETERFTALMNPLITYPRADAMRITFILRDAGGRCLEAVVPLRPTPGRNAAYYLHPGGKAFDIGDIATEIAQFYVPAADAVKESFPCHCAIADESNPLKPTDVQAAGAGRVTGVAGCFNATSLVETPRFAVFAEGGTLRLATGMEKDMPVIKSIRRIDSRSLNGEAALCSGGAKVYALLGGDLAELSGTTVRTLTRGITTPDDKEAALGYSRRGELWISTAAKLLIRCDTGGYYMRLETGADGRTAVPRYRHMLSAGGELYGTSSLTGAISVLSQECAGDTYIEWTERVCAPDRCRPARLRRVVIGATASHADLHMAVNDAYGPGPHDSTMPRSRASAKIAEIRMQGMIYAPIVYPVVSAPVCAARVSVKGLVNAGMRLDYIDLCF